MAVSPGLCWIPKGGNKYAGVSYLGFEGCRVDGVLVVAFCGERLGLKGLEQAIGSIGKSLVDNCSSVLVAPYAEQAGAEAAQATKWTVGLARAHRIRCASINESRLE